MCGKKTDVWKEISFFLEKKIQTFLFTRTYSKLRLPIIVHKKYPKESSSSSIQTLQLREINGLES